MSNPLAIAAVTATLRNLLDQGANVDPDLSGASVTTLPLDQARTGVTGPQLNLFLYQTQPNAAWRNMDLPGTARPGETSQPPLPLDLYYLITAYGPEANDGVIGHRLLGRAMSVLHDHPVLGAEEIRTALPGNDLHDQIERVRIVPYTMSLDDLTKLWTAFQTGYRISTAYHVSVVLIESRRPPVTPLPVLTIGPNNRGVVVQPDLLPPFPAIATLSPPNDQESIRLGEVLTIVGRHLDGDDITVRFTHPRLTKPIDLDPLSDATSSRIQVRLEIAAATDAANWPAGFYLVSVIVRRTGEPERTTNEVPVALAPRITSTLPATVARDDNGDAELSLTVAPQVFPDQRAALLLGDRQIEAEPHETQTASLTFSIVDAPLGNHFVRVRIDGVDSLFIDRSVTPPVFDTTQQVTITT
jgi:hypothetical protein